MTEMPEVVSPQMRKPTQEDDNDDEEDHKLNQGKMSAKYREYICQ